MPRWPAKVDPKNDVSSNGENSSSQQSHAASTTSSKKSGNSSDKKQPFWSSTPTQKPHSSNTTNIPTMKIKELTIGGYCNNYIAGRVCYKSALRDFEKDKIISQVFIFDLMDSSALIRISAYGEQAKNFNEIIQMNKCFRLQNLKIKAANPIYTPLNIKMEGNTVTSSKVEPIPDTGIPWMNFNCYKLNTLKMLQDRAVIDVMAVVVHVGEIQTYAKDGKNGYLRRLTLVDQSLEEEDQKEIIFTLWGEDAQSYAGKGIHTICIKNVQKSSYLEAITLSSCKGCCFWTGDELDGIKELKAWISEFSV